MLTDSTKRRPGYIHSYLYILENGKKCNRASLFKKIRLSSFLLAKLWSSENKDVCAHLICN